MKITDKYLLNVAELVYESICVEKNAEAIAILRKLIGDANASQPQRRSNAVDNAAWVQLGIRVRRS
jgi:predicted acetyltransferase